MGQKFALTYYTPPTSTHNKWVQKKDGGENDFSKLVGFHLHLPQPIPWW
jgi:hypothetical protein